MLQPRSSLLTGLYLLVGAAVGLPAQGLVPLGDLNPGFTIRSSFPRELIEGNGALFCSARFPQIGQELAVIDLSSRSVTALDLNPNGFSEPSALVWHAGHAWFHANNGTGARRVLFVSDGTRSGTRAIPLPGATQAASVVEIAGLGNGVVVAASDGRTGVEPWFVDVATRTPIQLADIEPGLMPSDPSEFTLHQGRLFFRACSSTRGCSLWVTDGTPQGTVPATSAPWPVSDLAVVNGELLMTSRTATSGNELFRLEGSTLRLLADTSPGSASGARFDLRAPLGTGMAFQGNRSLWVTDGTPTGTRRVGAGPEPSALIPAGGRVLTWSFGSTRLWASDGTAAGTMIVADLNPGGQVLMRHGDSAQLAGGRALFSFDDRADRKELWSSDGTAAGTVRLHAITDRVAAVPEQFLVSQAGAGAYFQATSATDGTELWWTDGTPAGTGVFVNLVDEVPLDSEVRDACDLLDRTLFAATTAANGSELWVSDGTAAGTSMVLDIEPGEVGSAPGGMTRLGNLVLFAATTSASGRELWVTDGTAGGTRQLVEFGPGGASGDPFGLTRVGDEVWFTAGSSQRAIWRSDGTVSGTVQVAPGFPVWYASDFTRLGAQVCFVLWSDHFDRGLVRDELWITDGTAAGTRIVTDLFPGTHSCGPFGSACPNSSGPQDLTVWNGRLWFTAMDAVHGRELWSTDGTAAGTTLAVDSSPTGGMDRMIRFRDRFWFASRDTATGMELWVGDGTPAGTFRFADLQRGPGSSWPQDFALLGSRFLLFTADDGASGREPWVTDGTLAGTRRLVDLVPGVTGSRPGVLRRGEDTHAAFGYAGGSLWIADDGRRGAEPWFLSLGATATPVRPGGVLAAAAPIPQLHSGDPVLGGRVTLEGESGPGTATVVLLGPSSASVTHWLGMPVYLDLGTTPQVLVAAAGGAPWQASFTLPGTAALHGARAVLQAVDLPVAAGADFAVSAAVQWVLGN